MGKIKVLFVAPYEGLKNLAATLFGSETGFDLDIRVGDLEMGAKLVRESNGRKYDVIISRGGTAELIKNITDVPVVDIELSQYDILHAIKLSHSYSGKIAIVGFPKIIERVEAICSLLDYDMNINVVSSAEQVPACLSKLKAEGYSLIIGDTVTVATAKELQMNGILITSGSESVLSAFAEAEKICAAAADVRRMAGMYEDMLEKSGGASLALAGDGKFLFRSLPEYLEENDAQTLENWCRTAAGEVFKKGSGSSLRKFKGFSWNITGRRGSGEFEDIAYFYITRGLEISHLEKAVQIQSALLYKPAANSSFYDDSESTQRIVEQIRRLGGISLPVVIFGEPGTGKDTAAFEIYRYGSDGDKAFLTIDCQVLEEKQLDYLLHNEKSPLLWSGIGIYFKRVDMLDAAAQRMLVLYMSDSLLYKRNRVIFSCEVSPSESCGEMLISRLLNESGQECLTLHLPSLRARANDIPSIASIYINDLNIVMGKQVAGLDAESIEMLREFSWRTNITQLKNVLRELVLITDGAFISGSDTKRVLQKEETYLGEPDSPVFLKGTLDEITLKVVRRVLEEEGMNQSRAAKRLGVSRSTLWRKLQG